MINHSDTQFLRALGMILIINSHLDHYYPIPHIGTGGALGNSIFFCLSAFGIYLSQQRNSKPFIVWFHGRISRIYPSIWIVLIFLQIPIMFLLGSFNNADYIFTFIGKFFNPPFWFLQALLVYYVLSFFFLKDNRKSKLFFLLGALGVLYFTIYFSCLDLSKWLIEDHPFKLIHYFMVFLFGIYLAINNKSITYTGWHNYLVPVLMIIIIYGHKIIMTKGLYPELQFIQQMAMYPFVFYLLKISRSPHVSALLGKSRTVSTCVNFIADHSLELYIIQETLVVPLEKLNFPIPLNVIIFLCLTFILSALTNRLAVTMRKKIS